MPDAKTTDALLDIYAALSKHFGPSWAWVLLLAPVILSFASWCYNEWKLAKEIDRLTKRCDAEIERLAEQERGWRVLFLTDLKGWKKEDAEDLVIRNKFKDSASARKALEGEELQEKPKKGKKT